MEINLFDTVPECERNPNGIRDPDGILRCKVCGEKLEKEINWFGKTKIVPLACSCRMKEIEAMIDGEKQREIIHNRTVCFQTAQMHSWTFENSDGSNKRLSDALERYCDNYRNFLREGKGIMLYGDCGTGKTYLAACVANRLIDNGYRVRMTNFPTLINQIQATFDHRQDVIDEINSYSLLIIDDLGVERQSPYMLEQVYNIIDSRYRIGKPIIITTNLTGEQLKNPNDLSLQRIYDRILEKCHPIKMEGKSKRRDHIETEYHRTNKLLGLE